MSGLDNYDMNVIETREVVLGDDIRFGVGEEIVKRFFNDAWLPTEAGQWLVDLGFEYEFLLNVDGDRLLLLLWRYGNDESEHGTLDEFILEFSGHDAQYLTLFNISREKQV